MKSCPICGARAFDDAETCFGCLHRYADEEPVSAPAVSAPTSASAAPAARRQPTVLAPDAPAPATASVPAAPAPTVPEEAWPDPDPEPAPEPAPASEMDAAPGPADPGPDDPGFCDEYVCGGFGEDGFQPCVALPTRPDAAMPPSAFSLSLPLSEDSSAEGWTLRLEWPRAAGAAATASGASRGFVLSLQPARPAARGSHARAAGPAAASPSGLA